MGEGTITERPRALVIIERPRLTKLLDEAGARVNLLVAPAGYGKTTLGRQWTERKDAVGWYTGGPGMVDVAALSVGLAEVLGRMGEPAREDMVERTRILAAHGHSPRGLAKAVSVGAPGHDWLLVVDDYHYALDSEDADAFFEELVALTEFRLLITTRERPAWLEARKIVYGEAAVVEMDALAFTDDEARAVLGDIPGREQFLGDARGWPAVVGLAAMRGIPAEAAGLPPEDLYRFFAEDLYRSASPALREAMFLLALAGGLGEGSPRSLLGPLHREVLDEAAERGFLGGHDRRRVHPLLRGFLLAKLGEFEETEIQALVARAVEYAAGQGRWDDCLFALERFPDDELIISTLKRGLSDMLDSGRVATVGNWSQFARRRRSGDPLLLLADAEIGLRRSDFRAAKALGERAGTALRGDMSARAYLAAGRAAHLSDEQDEAIRLSQLALRRAVDPSTRFDALWTEFVSAAELGTSTVDETLSELERLTVDTSQAFRFFSAKAIVHCLEGRADRAIAELETGRGLMARVVDPFARTNLLHELSYVHLVSAHYEDSLALALELVDEGRKTGLEFAVDYGFLRAACANIGMRQMRQAHRVIAALDRRSNDASAFILDNVILLRVRLAIAVGDVARALTLLDRQFAGGNRPAFRAEVRAYRSILLAAQGRTDDALAQLESDERSLWFAEADALRSVSRAIMALESGLSTASRDALVAAVLTGCGDSVVTGMRAYPELARWLAADKELRAPLRDLLFRSRDFDIARSAGLKMPRETRPRQRLSPREQDVYDLLAEGRANREIAKALFISESTTKVHVRHIFEKLGVHTRAEAARLASSDEEPTL